MYNLILLILLILLLIICYCNRKNNFTSKQLSFNSKKIALCFLIYEGINKEDIWYNYLKNIDKTKYNIYIHYKYNKPLKYFENYKLNNCIDTCWGCLSVVLAQIILLKEAIKDKNTHFIFLSDSCIPVKNFNYVYDFLKINKSYFNHSPDNQRFPRADPLLKYIKKENIKKNAMNCIINRKHAHLFINNINNIKKWFKNINNVDELTLLTLIYHNNLEKEIITTPNLATDAVFYSGWPNKINYKIFEKSILKKRTPNEYNHIDIEELMFFINSKTLFARKFTKNCTGLENLIELLI